MVAAPTFGIRQRPGVDDEYRVVLIHQIDHRNPFPGARRANRLPFLVPDRPRIRTRRVNDYELHFITIEPVFIYLFEVEVNPPKLEPHRQSIYDNVFGGKVPIRHWPMHDGQLTAFMRWLAMTHAQRSKMTP